MSVATVKRVGLPQWHVLSIAGEAKLDPRTVYRILAGTSGPRSNNCRQQVIDAAARLGIPLPGLDELQSVTRVRAT